MRFALVYFIVFILSVPKTAFSQVPKELNNETTNAFSENNSIERHIIISYLQKAATYDKSGDAEGKERAFDSALSQLWQPEKHHLRMLAYKYYFGLTDSRNIEHYMSNAQQMLQDATLCNEDYCLTQAHITLANGYLKLGNLNDALRESSLGLIHAGQTDQHSLLIDAELIQAEILARMENKNARTDALNIFLRAKTLAKEDDDPESLIKTYAHISAFYADIGGYDSAAAYKERQINLVIKTGAKDSTKIQTLKMELSSSLLKGVNKLEGNRLLNGVIKYAIQNHDTLLLNNAMLYYRNYYLESRNLTGIARLYDTTYRQSLGAVKDPALKCRILAYIYDAQNRKDSALHFYEQALAHLKEQDNLYQYAFLQIFHGRALRRWGLNKEAIINLQAGYSAMPTHLPFTIQLMREIDSSFLSLKEYDSAYKYHIMYEKAQHDWDLSINGEALLRQQLSAQMVERELSEARIAHLNEQKHFTQYMAIILGIAILFLVFSMLSSFPVPKWTIRATGFFAFVVLFEFIIMIADEEAVEKVHGEPLFFLLCKIGIIMLLSPLHHKLEERLLHYFYKHKLIDTSKIQVHQMVKKVSSIFKRNGESAPEIQK